MKQEATILLLTFAVLPNHLFARQLPYEGVKHFADTKEERIKWFKEAKLGMFIHWGLYSGGAGYFKGKKYTAHYAEWIQVWSQANTKEYAKELVPKFTAAKYDANVWAELAKKMGARYAVLTTKHHDGFTLFSSKHPYAQKENNPYGVEVNISPEGRDIVREYADAFRKQGIKVGLYYSLIDWQHPDAPFHYELNNGLRTNNRSEYLKYYQSHLKQLMTEYGQIDLLWADYSNASKQGKTWDTAGTLRMLSETQPHIVINNRFWNDIENRYGDYVTPEKYVPATGLGDQAWEVCYTMNESFGYSAHDNRWKSAEDIFKILVDANSKGGNLLLNVGPNAEGEIPPVAVEILNKFSDLVQKYDSEIFGTTASQFGELNFNGRSNTVLINDRKTRLNFFVYEYPENGQLIIDRLKNKVSEAYLTATKFPLHFVQAESSELIVDLPKERTDAFGWVVSVGVDGVPNVEVSK